MDDEEFKRRYLQPKSVKLKPRGKSYVEYDSLHESKFNQARRRDYKHKGENKENKSSHKNQLNRTYSGDDGPSSQCNGQRSREDTLSQTWSHW